MTPTERTEGQNPENQQPKIEMHFTPDAAETTVFQWLPDGRLKISFTGRADIFIPAALAPESPVTAVETPRSGLIPETTSLALTEQYRGVDKPSWEKSQTEVSEIPENENRRFNLVGNPAKKLGYRVTRKSNTRIADFVLATHPDKESTQYWRIRAFGDQAEKVRDQVEVGQKDVEVSVYGPKYWKGRRRKTKGGYEETVVKGYHAGFVRVPKRYKEGEAQQKQ
jgi:hypothetical protein